MKSDEFLAGHLTILAAVADYGGVTAAASALNLTQPAVSNRLRALETFVGAPVVVRSGRGVVLTELGERLVPHARAIVRATGRVGLALSTVREPQLGVRVALCQPSLCVAAPVVAAAAAGVGGLRVTLVPLETGPTARHVIAGDVDLAISVASPLVQKDDLARCVLLVDEIVLVRSGPQLAAADPAIIGSLTVLWQGTDSGVRATVEAAMEERGVYPAETVEVGSSLAVLASAAAGLGAGFLPRSFVEPWVVSGRVSATSLDVGVARFELIADAPDATTPAARLLFEALARRSAGGEQASPLPGASLAPA
jgi:DNA-binding transcriptional LysR family regulator